MPPLQHTNRLVAQRRQQQRRLALSPFEHQRIYASEVWLTRSSSSKAAAHEGDALALREAQCRKEVKGVCYYSVEDCTLGQFLIGQCFNLNLRCSSGKCKRNILEHDLHYMHHRGRIVVKVNQTRRKLVELFDVQASPPPPLGRQRAV